MSDRSISVFSRTRLLKGFDGACEAATVFIPAPFWSVSAFIVHLMFFFLHCII